MKDRPGSEIPVPPGAHSNIDRGRTRAAPSGCRAARYSNRPGYAPLWNNIITIAGMFLAAMAVLLLLTFALFSFVTPAANPYVNIVGYLVLPGLLGAGLVTMPIGILVKSWRLRRRDREQRLTFRFPRIDLNDPAQRRVAKVVVVCTFVLLPVVGVSSYHGYRYTDSADFCAKTCHAVMEPQATAYEHSPHARVACAECHIGEGAGWFVKSKLSGTRQVLATWRDSYARPIPPAIRHLRPARDTCERCHWPQKFYGRQLKELVRFSADENNTRREVSMLLNIGGGHDATGPVEGIHWHMALINEIEYVATEDTLQEIPWVRVVGPLGSERIYRSDGRPSSDPPPDGQVRRLDCMDCHNRPAHEFLAPNEAVDHMLTVGRIDTVLPFIKSVAVRALTTDYPDVETAARAIGEMIARFYEKNQPDVWTEQRPAVNRAIDVVREIYETNFFPEMRVDWRAYPDNIGHLRSPGCFRCHTERHIDHDGAPLSTRCDTCHTFLNRIDGEPDKIHLSEGDFIHPMDLSGVHATVRCDRCHTGGLTRGDSCGVCHVRQVDFIAGTTPAFEPFDIEPDVMADTVDCEACHDVSQRLTVDSMNETCLGCHGDGEERFDGMVAAWRSEAERLLCDAETHVGPQDMNLVDAVRRAGPLHNMKAARKILRSLAAQASTAGDEHGRPVSGHAGTPESHRHD